MDTLYTLDNITHYKTESVNFLGLLNSATKFRMLRVERCFIWMSKEVFARARNKQPTFSGFPILSFPCVLPEKCVFVWDVGLLLRCSEIWC